MILWAASLAVRVNGERGVVSPIVQLRGRTDFAEGTLGLELRDGWGSLRHAARQPLRPDQIGAEIHLASFPVPAGADPDEVVRWSWDIAVEADGAERIRWRRYLQTGDRISAEGEIELAGDPARLRPKLEEEGWGPEAPWDERDSERLLASLMAEGVIGPGERDEIQAERRESGRTVERILVQRKCMSERNVLLRYADVSGCEFVELAGDPIDPQAAAMIPEELARRHGLIGIGFRGGLLTVAMSDPQRKPSEVSEIYDLARGPIYIVVATRADVLAALDALPARQ